MNPKTAPPNPHPSLANADPPITQVPIWNPSFDDGFHHYHDINELNVAIGWIPWWKQGTEEEIEEGYLKRPEYQIEAYRIISPPAGQKFFNTYATHDAGLYQLADVTPGTTLTLTAQVQLWSVTEKDAIQGGYALRVGIDPFGNSDPFNPEVVWGRWRGQDDPDQWQGDTWQTITVTTPAQGPKATLFINGKCRYRTQHNDAYLEDVRLIAEGAIPKPPDDLLAHLRWLQGQAEALVRGLADAAGTLDQVMTLLHRPLPGGTIPCP